MRRAITVPLRVMFGMLRFVCPRARQLNEILIRKIKRIMFTFLCCRSRFAESLMSGTICRFVNTRCFCFVFLRMFPHFLHGCLSLGSLFSAYPRSDLPCVLTVVLLFWANGVFLYLNVFPHFSLLLVKQQETDTSPALLFLTFFSAHKGKQQQQENGVL